MAKLNKRNVSAQEALAAPVEPRPLTGQVQASAQILTFEPGLYAIDIHAAQTGMTESGLTLPCARLDPIDAGIGRAVVVALSAGGWISPSDGTMFLRVLNDATDIVLTTYRLSGTAPALDLRIRAIRSIGAIEMGGVPVARGAAPARADAQSLAHVTLTVLAHVERLGDVMMGPGEWAGAAGRDCAVEGFSIQPQNDLADIQIEYQAILGDQWQTPWFPNGAFCGSRGMSLPLLGFRLRLVGDSAQRYECRYSGVFLGGEEVGPLSDGQACEASAKSMTGMKIEITALPEDGGEAVLLEPAALARKARVSRLPKLAGRGR